VYHARRIEWGLDGCEDVLENFLNSEDQGSPAFSLDRIVPLVYAMRFTSGGMPAWEHSDDDVVEQRCELVVITTDHFS